MSGVLFDNKDLMPLAVGMMLWTILFFFNADRQSRTRRVVRREFLSRLKKENGGEEVDLKAFGDPKSIAFMRNEPAINNDARFIRADRTFANQIEQAVVLFPSLLIFAVIVTPRIAGYMLLWYTGHRAAYFYLYNDLSKLVLFSTMPNYLCILIMNFWSVARTVF